MSDRPSEEIIDLKVVECIERCEREGPDAVDAFCRENPDLAGEVRKAVTPLLAFGLLGDDTATADVYTDDEGETLPVGTVLAGYEIIGELGRGGMGVVYEAHDPVLDRSVALKVLRGAGAYGVEGRERFRREAAAAGSLQHENLVRVYGFGVENGNPWLAMELIEGVTLDVVLTWLRNGSQGVDAAVASHFAEQDQPEGATRPELSPRELRCRIELGIELCAGLRCVHANGIVHRDIKPSNVIVRRDGRPVVTDFGLALRDDLPSMTKDGSFAGTPYYASPEQAAGRTEEVDACSDVFCLGSTLYELVTLQRPFSGSSTVEVLRTIVRVEPRDPARIVPSLPDDIAAILLKALSKERKDRYATMAEFGADLGAFLEMRPVSARRASSVQRLRRWMRREPVRAALGAVLAVGGLLVAGLIGFAISRQPLVHAAERQLRLDDAADATMAGFFAMSSAREDFARAEFDRALRLNPDASVAVVGRVMAELAPGNAGKALEILAPYIAAEPDNPVWARLQSLCLDSHNQSEQAALIKAALGEPRAPLELFLEGCSLLRGIVGREFKKGGLPEKSLREVLNLFQAAIAGSDHPVPIYYMYLADMVVSRLKDEHIARRLAYSLTHLWPNKAIAYSAAGQAVEWIDIDAAQEFYRKALELEPESLDHRVILAQSHYRQGDTERAEREFNACLALGAKNPGLHSSLARILGTRQEFEAAVSHAKKAVALSRVRYGGQWILDVKLLMGLLERCDKADEAIAIGEAAIEENPRITDFHTLLLRWYKKTGDTEASKRISRSMIERAPEFPLGWLKRAEVLIATGDLDGAIAAFRKGCELLPEDPRSWCNLATYLLRTPDGVEEAVSAARKGVELSGFRMLHPLYVMGWTLLRSGELDEAERFLRMGLDVESLPQFRDARLKGLLDTALAAVANRRAGK